MAFQDLPIKVKATAVIMLTSITVLFLTAAAFTAYDVVSYREGIVRNLSTIASILADSCRTALLLQDKSPAQQLLDVLHSKPQIVAAALYDERGNLFVRYPAQLPLDSFPGSPGAPGCRFEAGHLVIFQPSLNGDRPVGTLYLKSDFSGLYKRLQHYAGIAAMVLVSSIIVALLISTALQRRITSPILALADVARLVSRRNDYSTRAPKTSNDELGLLTDAFNSMLTRIQEQTVALKESEERLRLAMEGSGTGAWDWNLTTGNITGDDASHRLAGLRPDTFTGTLKELNKLIHPADRHRVKTRIELALKSKAEVFTEFRVVWPDQSIHYLSARGRALYDPAGQPVRMNGVIFDLTESKRAEENIRRLNEELEQRVEARTADLRCANQELEAFTYSVAHDLRAPLRHVDAFSRILSEDFGENLPPEARRYLDNIRNGTRNMSHLVDDLLNLARVGRQELKREPIPLAGLVNEVMAELKHETEDRTIEWHVHPLPTIECDSGLMKQVFANLLSNAVKYTRPRKVAIIEIGAETPNGTTAVFVRDNGVGFNMRYAGKLFGVFQRLHRAEEFEGTGVGLATVDRIVRKHGGAIWAQAEENHGATFYFTLSGLSDPPAHS